MGEEVSTTPSFLELQSRLGALDGHGLGELTSGTIVVIPSISFPPSELRKIVGIERYEERLLCLLLLLAEPGLEMVYVTSAPIDPAVIGYYLSFLDDPEGARKRLTLVDLDDPEPRALSDKLVEDHAALDRIRAAIRDPERAYVLPFNVTEREREIAEALGVPVFGPLPELVVWGSKSGGRQLARSVGVPVLEGSEDLFSVRDLDRAIQRLRARRPEVEAVVIKLNNGFSGQGNAIVGFDHLESSVDLSPTTFCAAEESWPSYAGKVETEGAIVEEIVKDPRMVSPSVQVRIAPDATIEMVSTHDQILGGPDNQVYVGCRFPARAEYRAAITAHARAIAQGLADRDVIGSFGMDFVVVPDGSGHDVYLSEINLRLGGTTHPFLMAKLVTGGIYDQDRGELVVDGRPLSYIGTDNLKSEAYVGRRPAWALEVLQDAGVAYDPTSKTGATLHLLGPRALREARHPVSGPQPRRRRRPLRRGRGGPRLSRASLPVAD